MHAASSWPRDSLPLVLIMIAKYTQCVPLHDDCYIRVYWNCASMMGRSLMATATYILAMWHCFARQQLHA